MSDEQNKTMMKIGENSDSISTDLALEILSRLPSKSIARFRCVSKLWDSKLRGPHFMDMFLTRSSARPRLLFAVERNGVWLFYSSPHNPQNRYQKSSLVVSPEFHTKFSRDISPYICGYASGLIYFPDMWIGEEEAPVICNPITGQYESLPELERYRKSRGFLGFDPIDKQFKVLIMNNIIDGKTVHHILSCRTGDMSWRQIEFPLCSEVLGEGQGICINGVLYYLAETWGTSSDETPGVKIVCFDVRAEEFEFIDAKCFSDPHTTTLINYKGKLGGIDWKYDDADAIELCLWVLEDVEKQEWTKFVYTLPENEVGVYNVFVVGMTARGEIVLSEKFTSKPFYVLYFNPERNTLQTVEIQGVGANHEAFESDCRVYTFVDYVEDLNVNDANLLKSSISAPSVKNKRSLNCCRCSCQN